jgi:hypothetical protein
MDVWQDECGHPGALVTGGILRLRLLGPKFIVGPRRGTLTGHARPCMAILNLCRLRYMLFHEIGSGRTPHSIHWVAHDYPGLHRASVLDFLPRIPLLPMAELAQHRRPTCCPRSIDAMPFLVVGVGCGSWQSQSLHSRRMVAHSKAFSFSALCG